MEYTVATATVFKTGTGAKGPWTIYKLTLVGDAQEPTGFDQVVPGDKVTVTQTQNGQYTNLNYKKVQGAAAAPAAAAPAATAPNAAAPVAGSDPRIMKMLVTIAEQVGVDKNAILDILG